MDSDSSPTRSNKRRKSDETEDNDNNVKPSTSHSQNNNANSSVVATTSEEVQNETNDSQVTANPSPIDGGQIEVELDVGNNETYPPPSNDGQGADDDSDGATASQSNFRTRGRRLTTRRNYRLGNRRSGLNTSSSSSDSSLDSLHGLVLNGASRTFLNLDRNAATSSDPDSNPPVAEYEVDSSMSSDSDGDIFNGYTSSNDDEPVNLDDGTDTAFNEIINKPKPSYLWNSISEIMHRERGLSGNGRRSLRNGISNGFQNGFYGSRHVVEKMKLMHTMHKHSGCVNCLNFNRAGNLLCTGSDDMKIIVWDWAAKKPKFSYKSGHQANVFQTKFVEVNGCMDIVSTSRDGQVRAATIPPSGGKIRTRHLYKHNGAVHKLALCPQNPLVILSAGEDGKIVSCDLRKSPVNRLKTVKEDRHKVPLYSIAHHPFAEEICVCGNDNYVRVYDKRNMSKTLHKMCPTRVDETKTPHITCCVYNSTGSEILASYSDDDIYLFNNKVYTSGQYEHRYRGHYNHKTIKGVNFFGPNSEYVISGSDCGNIFFWDKNTEAIINFMEGDNAGVVNCLEPHPTIPILATSGLDHNIKIWAPNSDTYPPSMSTLDRCVKKNLKRSVLEEVDAFDDRQFYYFVREFLRSSRPNDTLAGSFNMQHHTSSSSNESDIGDRPFSNDQIARALQPSCHPQ